MIISLIQAHCIALLSEEITASVLVEKPKQCKTMSAFSQIKTE